LLHLTWYLDVKELSESADLLAAEQEELHQSSVGRSDRDSVATIAAMVMCYFAKSSLAPSYARMICSLLEPASVMIRVLVAKLACRFMRTWNLCDGVATTQLTRRLIAMANYSEVSELPASCSNGCWKIENVVDANAQITTWCGAAKYH
jgi:hypothetical protein